MKLFTKGKIKRELIKLTIQGKQIPWVNSFKYLVIFDNHLKWINLIEHICTREQQDINLLRALIRYWWGAEPIT